MSFLQRLELNIFTLFNLPKNLYEFELYWSCFIHKRLCSFTKSPRFPENLIATCKIDDFIEFSQTYYFTKFRVSTSTQTNEFIKNNAHR